MAMDLESMAVEMPVVKGHPNRVAFRGVLTVVDVPSDRAPSGSQGKRVMLTRRAAEAAIPSLIGMAVDYAPSLDRHDARRKVGVITRADVVGRNLEVSGYLYAKDFPEIVEEIGRLGRQPAEERLPVSGSGLSASTSVGKIGGMATEGMPLRTSLASAVTEIRRLIHAARVGLGQKGQGVSLRAETQLVLMGAGGPGSLGMSFEVTKVNVLNPRARIWKLIEVTFTGAAILRKDKAAFRDTWIELE
ncbi:MAG TPA: hypothetical protein VMS18_28465 [Candidatus Binatia bacterium]|nr:hypothetical protein [Candidatus Binatia bacterium]